MLSGLQAIAKRLFRLTEVVFSSVFTDKYNPLYHLGALSFFFFWIIAVTGLYLFIFFETTIPGAYRSIEYLTQDQWYLGGIMRSLHRYASDAMVITVVFHFFREFALGRFRGSRWFAWLTGVILLWFLFSSGVSGYWLVWDKLAQYIAVMTSEWLDWLPIFTTPMARNFMNSDAISSRFFSLMVFLHIAIPLFLLFGMWIHILRISRTRTNPPRTLVFGTFAALMVASIAWPAISQEPANLDRAVDTVRLDWYYLFAYPFFDIWSIGTVWWVSIVGTIVLILFPWLPPITRMTSAEVDLANCNGCGRCFEDCPYAAVTMRPRTDGEPFEMEAVVNNQLCTGCGICAGACPTATPFRRQGELVAGIDIPTLTVQDLRVQTLAATEALTGPARVLVFGCRHALASVPLSDPEIGIVSLPCVAALSPTFIDFVISRKHADGVFLVGCGESDCYERFGVEWTQQRIAGERDPYLRKRVPRERIAGYWGATVRPKATLKALRVFREQLRLLGSS